MKKEQRDALNREYHVAFDEDARKHEFDYWIVLGTRNIASAPRRARKLEAYAAALLPIVGVRHADAKDAERPAWKKSFDAETDSFHPRAYMRKMPTTLRRHHTYWTAQELYDVHVPRFLRQVAKANQAPIRYGVWIEHGKWNGRPHANVALGKVGKLSIRTLDNIWNGMNGGRAEIRVFDAEKNTGYHHKCIGREQIDMNGNVHELLWMANYWADESAKGPGGLSSSRQEAA